MNLPPLTENPGVQPTASDFVKRGWCTVPTLRDKHPGVKSDAPGLLEQADQLQGSRYNVIIGSRKNPNRCGILDVETDGPLGEVNLLRACGSIPDGPCMITPSGSVHRLFRWPIVPDGYRVRIGWGLLEEVDIPWQFFALDGDNRVWHNFDLAVPDLPQGLYDLVVIPETQVVVEAGEPYHGRGYGTPEAVVWLESRCEAISNTPWEEGAGWNDLFSRTVYGAAGMAAAGALDASYAQEQILDACEDPYEAVGVFESAWGAGSEKPWSVEPKPCYLRKVPDLSWVKELRQRTGGVR